jgi:hypothetical protein
MRGDCVGDGHNRMMDEWRENNWSNSSNTGTITDGWRNDFSWCNSSSSGFFSNTPLTLTISLKYYNLDTLVIDKEKGILTITQKEKKE